MKKSRSSRNILIAFILNLSFSVFEFFGGVFTGSFAIISDAVHDIADASSIGISYFLEKKSKKRADEKYTYGYLRYSVLGGYITTVILLIGSFFMIYNAIRRIITPNEINYNGMIVFAVAGVCVNLCAAFFTRDGDSINQKAVNLHMLEDVLGWIVVLAGALIMRFTNYSLLDPIMSLGVSLFILINAVKNLREITDLFLEKIPKDIDISEVKRRITEIDGIFDVHHIHIRSLDGYNNYATMHIVADGDIPSIKAKVREELHHQDSEEPFL